MESVIATREEIEFFLPIQQTVYVCCRHDCGIISSAGNGCSNDKGFGVGGGSGGGSVDGQGNGYGSGDGSSFIHGKGYGYGSCPGSGCDDSSGYCGGYGDIKTLNGNTVDYIDRIPTIITQVRGNIARGYFVKEDITLESCFIIKVGDSFAHGKTLKEAVIDAKAKEMKKMPVEERIEKFREAFGPLNSEHIGEEFYVWHGILTGSCRMGRDEFCKVHDIDLMKKYTVRYFLDITKDSYGSDVIKLVRESYENMEE